MTTQSQERVLLIVSQNKRAEVADKHSRAEETLCLLGTRGHLLYFFYSKQFKINEIHNLLPEHDLSLVDEG